MKSRSAWLIFFGLSLLLGNIAEAEQPIRFYLSFAGMLPKSGDEMERTFQVNASVTLTNFAGGHESVTNWTDWLDLQFRSKIFTWDPTNDYAKVEVVLEHALSGDIGRTNEFAESGSKLAGTFIAGEWFFRPLEGNIPNSVVQAFGRLFLIDPRSGIPGSEGLKLDQPRFVGERWDADVSMGSILPGLQKGVSGEFARSLNRNNTKVAVQFVGITNCLGFKCFQLNLNADISGHSGSVGGSAAVSIENISPIEPSVSFWRIRGSASGPISSDGTPNQAHYGKGLMICEFTSTCRPIMRK
jgi:hypothetical protein